VGNSSSAPRARHDPSCGTVADCANPRASRRRSGPPDAIREPSRPRARPLLSTGKTAFTPFSSNASLNHPVNHFLVTAGRCITFHTIRLGVSAARHGRATWTDCKMSPNPQISNSFRHQSKVATGRRRRRIRDSSDENGANGPVRVGSGRMLSSFFRSKSEQVCLTGLSLPDGRLRLRAETRLRCV
jgi:hypothetical protein